jgi:hypothetical protein
VAVLYHQLGPGVSFPRTRGVRLGGLVETGAIKFQSTHARGATSTSPSRPQGVRFQSTHREGCYTTSTAPHRTRFVSIHAPRGVDVVRASDDIMVRVSIQHREGCEATLWRDTVHRPVSIHAPARVDIYIAPSSLRLVFQSTHREGCDLSAPPPTCQGVVSIHATREGCDAPVPEALAQDLDRFIHAPARVRQERKFWDRNKWFHPPPARGATSMRRRQQFVDEMFQSTHREGCDSRLDLYEQYRRVSIHAPRGVRGLNSVRCG